MNPLADRIDLGPDQFAILFETERGIEASDLGNFLKRAATLARGEGAELRVVRIEPGSLVTIFQAVRSSKVVRRARKEFMRAPIASSGVITGIVAAVATGLIWAFDIDQAGATPISKAGACIVEEREVTAIKLITLEDTVLLMDQGIAKKVRKVERQETNRLNRLSSDGYKALMDKARSGVLEGEVIDVRGRPYFEPDGYRFLVPIEEVRSHTDEQLMFDTRVRILGELIMRNGRPDSIVIQSLEIM